MENYDCLAAFNHKDIHNLQFSSFYSQFERIAIILNYPHSFLNLNDSFQNVSLIIILTPFFFAVGRLL